jgi:hypothetical protein
MIDALVGGEDKRDLPKELTNQKDGKLVDHMFIGEGLIEQSELPLEQTYYIGDSKYYKRCQGGQTHLGETSIYKQYTYARNVIQWNMNLFLDGKKTEEEQPQLRDTLTEGYNPIPNFFISARIPNKQSGGDKFLSFDDKEIKPQNSILLNRQFENRLFDRDTLLLCHYDVNFLYLVSLYGRDNKNAQAAWREYIRKEFRKKIQSTLNELYTFRVLQPRAGMDCYEFIQSNFHMLNGKIYRPKTENNYLVLALLNDESDLWEKTLKVKKEKIDLECDTNRDLLKALESHFHVSDPFKIESEVPINSANSGGTLQKIANKAVRNILTGLVRKSDKDYNTYVAHSARNYTMEKIPTSINIMNVEYFLPMVGGKIDGYYKVEKLYIGSSNSQPCLKLNLSTYIPLGDAKVHIYRTDMQPGELISHDTMLKMYQVK